MTPEQIKSIRAARGMTQADLAAALGITRGHVAKLENATQKATGPLVIALKAIALLGHPDTWPDSITMIPTPSSDQLIELMDQSPQKVRDRTGIQETYIGNTAKP